MARAVDGDKAALEEVIRLLSDPLYRLALRMAWRPADAEDATQEILIRVVTRLASWRGEAKLLTWAYRIGVNYLLNLRRQTPHEAQQLSLDEFGANLADGLADADYRGPEAAMLAQEVRLSCTHNAADLRTSLLSRGHRFRSHTDTEAVLHLYEEYGDGCVEMLRGMFAFAIWDAKQKVDCFLLVTA